MKVYLNWGTGGGVVDMPPSIKLTPHFSLKEMANNIGNAELAQFELTPESMEFLKMLEEFRLWYNHPIKVNSCYRQKPFNALIGGDKNSAHLHACAIDWAIKNHNPQQRSNVTNQWKRICEVHRVTGAVGLYSSGYHLEAFSDKWFCQKGFVVRDYRGKKGSDW